MKMAKGNSTANQFHTHSREILQRPSEGDDCLRRDYKIGQNGKGISTIAGKCFAVQLSFTVQTCGHY
jgi:hypothetical protein